MKKSVLLFAGLLMLMGGGALAGERGSPTSACPQGVVTLRLLRSINNPPQPDVVSGWEAANPCVKIDVNEVPFLGYDGPNTASYAAAGMLLPLDPYLPAGFKDDVTQASLTEHSYQGKLYSPGTQQTTLAMFYNATLLDKLDIHPPKDLASGWTWAQALDAIKKCQQGAGDDVAVWGLAPSRFGTGQPGFVYRDLLFERSAGDPKAPPDSSAYKTYFALSPDGKTADGWLNTPEAVVGATFYRDLFNVVKVTPKAGIPTAFQDGRACFTLDTSYFMAGLVKSDPGFKWGVTPLPYIKSPIVHTGSVTLGVSSKTKFPAEAAKFVIDTSTGATAVDYAHRSRILPVLKSVGEKMPELNEYPLSIFYAELQSWGQPRPPSPHFAQYDKIVSDSLRDIAYGADPKTRLDAAVRTLQPILSH